LVAKLVEAGALRTLLMNMGASAHDDPAPGLRQGQAATRRPIQMTATRRERTSQVWARARHQACAKACPFAKFA